MEHLKNGRHCIVSDF